MLFKNIDIVDEDYEVQRDMNLLVQDRKIKYIGKEMPEDYNGRIFNGKNKLLVPGFFNTHCHVPMTMLRGYGDGLTLHRWLHEKIFPYEAKLTGEDCYWGAMHGAIEMIKSGVVSFSDMYFFIEDITKAVRDSGLKANISHGISSFSEDDKYRDLKGYIDTVDLYELLQGENSDRIRVDVGLHAEYTSNLGLVKELAKLSKEKGLRVQTHVSETKSEHENCKEKFGMTPIAYFEKNGLLDTGTTAAHCVWIEDEDLDIFKENEVTVAHCISSNLKLGSGFAPIKNMIEKGINVTIGTDGASSNNNLNMLEEMHLVAMVNKGVNHDPQFLNTKEILKMVTYNGAISQGRENCGQIKVGNRADLLVFDMDKPHLQPVHDHLSNIIYSAQSNDIELSMIDGEIVYRDGEVKTIDVEKVIYEVNKRNNRILNQL